jgi:hypothetical protein
VRYRTLATSVACMLAYAACISVANAANHPFMDNAIGARHGVSTDLGPRAADPIVPEPLVARPPTAHCKVTLLSNYAFDNYSQYVTPYAPPSGCRGRWSKVVLDLDTTVAGVQYDRLMGLWINGTEIYRGTTVEPSEAGIEYHVEKDVTNYSYQLAQPGSMTAMLGNIVNSTYTGIYYVTATLTFYAPGPGVPVADVPDEVVPIDNPAGTQGLWFALNTPTDSAGGTLTLPTNIDRADLEVYASGHNCEEFWYSNESTAYEESTYGSSCGGTPYRELDVLIDGRLAGVVYPYPLLYTGGINPVQWTPLPGVNALDIPPYRVNLTPFVGVLTNGSPHSITIMAVNDTNYWFVDADLLLYLDHGTTRTTGAVTMADVPANDGEVVDERNLTAAGGHAHYTAARGSAVAGYVNTSSGRVYTTVLQTESFENKQYIDNDQGLETIAMADSIATTTMTQLGTDVLVDQSTIDYPLQVDAGYPPPPSGSPYLLIINSDIRQSLTRNTTISLNGKPEYVRSFFDHYFGTGVLKESNTAVVFKANTQVRYDDTDSSGFCYGRWQISADLLVTTNEPLPGASCEPVITEKLHGFPYSYYPFDL